MHQGQVITPSSYGAPSIQSLLSLKRSKLGCALLRYNTRLSTLWEQANFGWMALHNCWELGLAPEVCKVVRFEVYLVVTRSIFGTDLIFF